MEVFLPDCGDLESWTWEAYARPYDYASIYMYIYIYIYIFKRALLLVSCFSESDCKRGRCYEATFSLDSERKKICLSNSGYLNFT